ncbi:MAG: Arsenite permease-like protein [Ignavibacteria bacterium]|nr:Arsenite permease-like protein [Ignavibacteria bacterium]
MQNSPPLLILLPFVFMLASIAILPIIAPRYWHKDSRKFAIALALGIPTAAWMLFTGLSSELFHTMIFDYLPFIIMLGTLFVISGGIFVDIHSESKPWLNTTFLAVGALLASFIGTTGASVLLIRPMLHLNKYRTKRIHTVLFFIAIVANCGGLLTPLGDPPLFLMYLRGVPFGWFLKLFPEWLFCNGILLFIYFFVDRYFYKKEDSGIKVIEKEIPKKFIIEGKVNFIWLAAAVVCVAIFNENTFPIILKYKYLSFIREISLIILAYLSLKTTRHITRVANGFEWATMREVAIIFFGIFVTMVPCMLYLRSNAAALGIDSATSYYFFTGLLSGFLDNTPTAAVFYSAALSIAQNNANSLIGIESVAGIQESIMKAICLGSVFFGAMTYIGNGPNFMIKSIATGMNIEMPHFFGYMLKFSLIVLLPVYILVQLLFL